MKAKTAESIGEVRYRLSSFLLEVDNTERLSRIEIASKLFPERRLLFIKLRARITDAEDIRRILPGGNQSDNMLSILVSFADVLNKEYEIKDLVKALITVFHGQSAENSTYFAIAAHRSAVIARPGTGFTQDLLMQMYETLFLLHWREIIKSITATEKDAEWVLSYMRITPDLKRFLLEV